MLNKENQSLCDEVIKKYGFTRQTLKVAEECSELSTAVAKILGGDTSKETWENYAEEVVDVLVVITQAVKMLQMTKREINARARAKLERALQNGGN